MRSMRDSFFGFVGEQNSEVTFAWSLPAVCGNFQVVSRLGSGFGLSSCLFVVTLVNFCVRVFLVTCVAGSFCRCFSMSAWSPGGLKRAQGHSAFSCLPPTPNQATGVVCDDPVTHHAFVLARLAVRFKLTLTAQRDSSNLDYFCQSNGGHCVPRACVCATPSPVALESRGGYRLFWPGSCRRGRWSASPGSSPWRLGRWPYSER